MAIDPDLQKLAQELAADPNTPAWEDAADLSRLHAQSFATKAAGGFEILASRGAIRLSGDGVHGNAISMSEAGEFLTRWQALVTSAGAALEGNKSIRGKLPDEIMRRTNLALVASPGRGSVVLEFSPVASTEAEERYPGGELTFEGPKQPLVQRAVEVALGVIDLAAIEDPLAVPANLAKLGPRVAAKALKLAELAAAGRFDVDMTWDEPGRTRRRSRTSARQMAQLVANLRSEHLDTEDVALSGVLRTVSDRRKIDLEVTDLDGEVHIVSIDRGEVDFSDFRIGESVQMAVTMRLISKPGGGESRRYTATMIERAAGT